jgi:hypothetical protein
MKSAWALLVGLCALGCTQEPVTLPLRSLERSGEVSFVCRGADGQGRDINSCPDYDSVDNPRHTLALVTQTLRGEVAVVDLSAGVVVDMDPSTPGFSFLPVGAVPTDIVSTPGGVASFVSVAEPGKEGIFGLPTTCLSAPAHDLTSWPACKLPAAPGKMVLAIDPPGLDDDGNPATPAPERASCDGPYDAATSTPGTALAATRADCPADLALEMSPPGRRKLIVSLPTLGDFAVIDAQSILDREPGSFEACPIERYIQLHTDVSAISQKIPDDLQGGCIPPTLNYGPRPGSFTSLPGGMSLADDGRLFISDRGAPIVHVYDMNDPCAPAAAPPLLPESFEQPNRVVTTSAVAVSPATTSGQRFAYTVDDTDGSVMVFDVTPGAANRTPLVFPGSPRLPFQAPDRIQLSAPAKDVAFALRDEPVADPVTGVATIGTECDPDPSIPDNDTIHAAVKYRPNGDYSAGASPHKLRGIFGFVMLTDGNIAVVDEQDFDAPCRRPIEPNSAATEDFRGCAGDPKGIELFEDVNGKRTVSDERSCHVVEPHRPRSARIMINASQYGINSPAIKTFPRLHKEDGSSLPTDHSDEGFLNPKLLASDFPSPSGGTPEPVQVYIGTDLYQSGSPPSGVGVIDTDPASAERLSLGLVLNEPRAFGGDEDVTLTYEGKLVETRKTGFLQFTPPGQADVITDLDGSFCDRGVEDVASSAQRAADLGVTDKDAQDAFAREHADYVQITSQIRGEDDGYWTNLPNSCDIGSGKSAYLTCRTIFGVGDGPTALTRNRDFRVLQAYQNQLMVEPREPGDDPGRDEAILQAFCCFGPKAVSYVIRGGQQWVLLGSGSGFRHNVIADAPQACSFDSTLTCNRCVRDCNPRRSLLDSRVFEISSRDCSADATNCPIGAATDADYACVEQKGVALPPKCIFQNINYRFAVYRGNAGLKTDRRDIYFSWSLTGAFAPLTANLQSQSSAVSPQSMVFVPQLGQLAVADGASEGLVLVSLDSVAVSRLFF